MWCKYYIIKSKLMLFGQAVFKYSMFPSRLIDLALAVFDICALNILDGGSNPTFKKLKSTKGHIHQDS